MAYGFLKKRLCAQDTAGRGEAEIGRVAKTVSTGAEALPASSEPFASIQQCISEPANRFCAD